MELKKNLITHQKTQSRALQIEMTQTEDRILALEDKERIQAKKKKSKEYENF